MDDRVVHSAVRMPGNKEDKRYTKGALITDPDELVASGIDLQPLFDAGVISGTWKGVKATKAEGESEAATKTSAKKGK